MSHADVVKKLRELLRGKSSIAEEIQRSVQGVLNGRIDSNDVECVVCEPVQADAGVWGPSMARRTGGCVGLRNMHMVVEVSAEGVMIAVCGEPGDGTLDASGITIQPGPFGGRLAAGSAKGVG